MASEEQRELDALLSELRATEAPPRDEASESARRRSVSRAIERRAHAYDPPRTNRTRARAVAAWTLGGVAAALLLVAVAASFRETETATVEAERLYDSKDSRVTVPIPASAASTRTAEPARNARAEKVEPSPRLAAPSAPRLAPSAVSSASDAIPSATPPAAEAAGASLAAQNALFQSAVRAARRGDDEGALREFDQLLEQFPTSPLAADSLVRKFRTLARLGRTAESAQAARDYLARYPQGFAATEAEKLLSTDPADENSGEP